MSIRDTYMKDYGISPEQNKELENFCRCARGQEQRIVLRMAQDACSSIAVPLFVSLTTGIGYDRQLITGQIPMQRKDFQGYRRKTLKLIRDFLVMHEDCEAWWNKIYKTEN